MPRKRTVRNAEVPGEEGMPISDDGTLLEMASDAAIETDITDAPKKSGVKRLADKLKGALFGESSDDADEPPAKRRSMSKARQADMAQIIGVGGALVLCWMVSNRIKDPAYAPVAPTMQEAQAIVEPYGRILARRMKAAGKLSEDALDIAASMSAILYYALRASDMHQKIKAEEERAQDYAQTQYQTTDAAYLSNQRESDASAVTSHPNGHRVRRDSRQASADIRTTVIGQGHQGSAEPIRREDELMDILLNADATGRAERGLL